MIADAKTRKTEEQTDLAERVADIRKAIQSRVDQQKKSAELMQKMIAENEKKLAAAKKDAKVKTKESDDDDVNFQEGMMETPEDQAITSILQSIGPPGKLSRHLIPELRVDAKVAPHLAPEQIKPAMRRRRGEHLAREL